MAELSKNQISGGTPVSEKEERKDTSKQYSGSPNKDNAKLASGDTVKKFDVPKPDAIDKRVDVAKLINYLRDSIQYSVDARRDWQDKLETWYKQYKGVVKEKNFPWEGCSNLHIPITGIIIDTLVSRMINPIFGTQPFVTARGVSQPAPQNATPGGGNDFPHSSPVSDHEKAYDVEHFLDFILTKRINVYPKIQDWIREAFIYGRGVMKIVWKEEYRKTTRKLARQDVEEEIAIYQEKVQSGDGSLETIEFLDQMAFAADTHDWERRPLLEVEREEQVYNNPDWVFIPIEDFIFHPRAIDIKSSPYVGHRFRMDYDDLLKAQDQGIYSNVDLLHPSGSGSESSILSSHGESMLKDVQTLEEGYDQVDNEADENLSEIELIEFHGKYDIDDDGRMEDIIATYAPKQGVLLSVRETDLLHGKKPFAEIKMFPVPGRFESQGVPEIITDLQQELNDIHNQRIDNGTITNAVMFWYDPNSDVDPEIHRPGPGMGFPAGPNQIGILQTGDVKFSSFREEELVRRLIQDRIGVSDFAIGNDATAIQNKTATGVSAIVNEGNQRLEMMLRNVAMGLNEAVLQTLQLVQQFGSDNMLFRIVEGAKSTMRQVSAREIQGQYDIDLAANSVNTNRLMQLSEIQQQLELALRAGPDYVNVSPLIKEFMRKSGSKMADEISVSETEAVLRKATANPDMLMALKEQIDGIAMQAGLIEPPQPQPDGQPSPVMASQPQQQGGGVDLQGIIQQAVPFLQQLFSGAGQQPPQQQGPPPPPQQMM